MSKSSRNRLVWLCKLILITVLTGMFVMPFSCRVTEEGIMLVSQNEPGPAIESFSVTGNNSARVVFSKSVKVKEASLTPAMSIADTEINCGDGTGLCLVDFIFDGKFVTGDDYRFYGKVQDRSGNTLTFSVPFSGYNGNVPELILTEIHPMYGSSTKSSGTVYKCEYVEIKALSSGNLSGLEIVSANDDEDKAYVFPAVQVAAGDVITVHLRKKEGMDAVSETGTDISLSNTFYSSASARDLWDENETARLGDSMDVIILRNKADGSVLDAVCYAPEDAEGWKTDGMIEMLDKAVRAGKWDSGLISKAVNSEGLTLSKSIERIDSGNGSASWRLTETSGTNPGTVSF